MRLDPGLSAAHTGLPETGGGLVMDFRQAGSTEALRAALEALEWDSSALARHLGSNDRLVRRWLSGKKPCPANIVQWLEAKASEGNDEIDANDLPAGWTIKARAGFCGLSPENDLDLDSIEASEEAAWERLKAKRRTERQGWTVVPVEVAGARLLDRAAETRWRMYVWNTIGPDHRLDVRHCRRTEAETIKAACAQTGQSWEALQAQGWRTERADLFTDPAYMHAALDPRQLKQS